MPPPLRSASLTSVLRMAFGGHFFTDVAAAGLVTFLVIWLAYAWIYRWPSTRLTDEGVDAALTRFATRLPQAGLIAILGRLTANCH